MTAEGNNVSVRWVMLAGTGLVDGTPIEDINVARAIGAELARHRYGLVTGGWDGVDYIATDAFVKQLTRSGLDSNDHLIQVFREGERIHHNVGKIMRSSCGANEWLEPQKYAEAVIIIGGLGGTYKTWLGAVHDGLPRFPIGGTRGDAAVAFRQTQEMWEVIPVPGITLEQFNKLGQPIDSPEAADVIAQYLVGELLWRSLRAVDATSQGVSGAAPSIFICYSRKDTDWMSRLRTLLRPAERRGLLSSWVDADIESGRPWENQLMSKLGSAQAALLLVSPALLESEYVRNTEIPAFIERMKGDKNFHLFWTLIEACNWQTVPELQQIQAIGDVKTPIRASLTKGDEQCRLIELVREIAKKLAV